MKVISRIGILCMLLLSIAAKFPGPVLEQQMKLQMKDCPDSLHFVIKRNEPFYAEISLERLTLPSNNGSMLPYIANDNKRDHIALAIGTRPHVSKGIPGTLLYFSLGTENPLGWSTGGAGFFIPKERIKAKIDWRDYKDGTLAIITMDNVRYRLHLKERKAI